MSIQCTLKVLTSWGKISHVRCAEAKRRASAFRRAFLAQLSTLQESITTFGKIGLGELFEMREECLRDFGFADVYRLAVSSVLSLIQHC